jgi:membrane protein YqaA with SNARE-associated domain
LRFVGVFTSFVQSAARKQSSYTSVLRHWGPFGLFFLAILDGSPMPTFGGLDILTAILAARHREPWYLYAGVVAAGSVIGAYLTFRMARRAGSAYLQKKFGERRVSKLLKYFERWGTGTLVVSALIPFPFPTSAFFAIAGVLDYPVGTFLIVVALARSARYTAIAAIASYYGRHFIRVLQHPDRHLGWISLIAGAVVILIVAAMAAGGCQREILSNGMRHVSA